MRTLSRLTNAWVPTGPSSFRSIARPHERRFPAPTAEAIGTAVDPVMLEVFNNLFMSMAEALLMAWMPPPTGIVVCHSDVSESIAQRESIHVRS